MKTRKRVKPSLFNVIPKFKGRRFYDVQLGSLGGTFQISFDEAIRMICEYLGTEEDKKGLTKDLSLLLREGNIEIDKDRWVALNEPKKKK